MRSTPPLPNRLHTTSHQLGGGELSWLRAFNRDREREREQQENEAARVTLFPFFSHAHTFVSLTQRQTEPLIQFKKNLGNAATNARSGEIWDWGILRYILLQRWGKIACWELFIQSRARTTRAGGRVYNERAEGGKKIGRQPPTFLM